MTNTLSLGACVTCYCQLAEGERERESRCQRETRQWSRTMIIYLSMKSLCCCFSFYFFVPVLLSTSHWPSVSPSSRNPLSQYLESRERITLLENATTMPSLHRERGGGRERERATQANSTVSSSIDRKTLEGASVCMEIDVCMIERHNYRLRQFK